MPYTALLLYYMHAAPHQLCISISTSTFFFFVFCVRCFTPSLMSISPFSGFAASDYSSEDVSSSAIIIEPVREDGIDAFLFFLPGALTPATDYVALVKEVQAQCKLRLWVSILDPGSAMFPSTAMIEASFDGVLERVKKLGFPVGQPPSKNVIFCGHSMGSREGRSPALKRADAFIQLGGSFHRSADNLVQYARPVLTLSGALDGQVTNAAIAKHAGEIFAQKDELGDYFVHVVKPVILIPGMNHAQFSHGVPDIARGDFEAEISDDEARNQSSHLISSFMMAHIAKAEDVIAASIASLREAVLQTQKQYKVFWEAIEDPARDVKKMQLKLAALPALSQSNVGLVHHDSLHNFYFSKPWIDSQPDRCDEHWKRIIMHAFFSPLGTFQVLSDMWAKFQSCDAAAWQKSGNAILPLQEIMISGAMWNEKMFKQALAAVPEGVRRKFEERGKKLRFVKDMVVESHEEWIKKHDLTILATPVEVQSPAFVTAGMHCIKLLTAARAFSWIYEDGFRPN